MRVVFKKNGYSKSHPVTIDLKLVERNGVRSTVIQEKSVEEFQLLI